LTHEIADELERVGGEVFGGVNRSKTFRVMVAYFATQLHLDASGRRKM
jgi:hypothetical protein